MARQREILKAILAGSVDEDEDDPVRCPLADVMTAAVTAAGAAAAAAACEPVLDQRTRGDPDARVEGFVEHVVPGYSNELFKVHFRMARPTFELLCEVVEPYIPCRTVDLEKKVLATVWLLGNQETFRSVADRFGMGKSSLHSCVMAVCNALITPAIMQRFIKWPSADEQREIAKAFREKTGFPGVVGCIDGTHIPISGPSTSRDSYINRKGFPSISVQAVCDHRLMFRDVFVGWPGSSHDERVFRKSPLSTNLRENPLSEDLHLLGDSAYALAMHMMVPFRDNGHLDFTEKAYNVIHSKTRVCIEHAFGLMKCKFRRMKMLEMHVQEDIPTVISAVTVLHNLVLESHLEEVEEAQNLEDPDAGVQAPLDDELPMTEARQKRRNIAERLA